MDKICLYKIYDPKDKKYSSGGASPKWTKRGKTWNSMGAVKLHLRNILCYIVSPHMTYSDPNPVETIKQQGFPYKNCVLHIFSADGLKEKPLIELFDEMKLIGYNQDKNKSVSQHIREVYGNDWL